MGGHQHRRQGVVHTRQAQDQVHAGISALPKGVFLHRSERLKPLADEAAHRQEAQRIPAGMARPHQLLQVGTQALLVIDGDAHGN